MQSTQAAVLSMLTRVQRFLDTNDAALGTIRQSAYSTELDDAVTALRAYNVDQSAARRTRAAHHAKQRVLGNALKLNHMRPIVAVATVQLREVPEFAALKMPRANSTSRTLIAAAGAMSEAASLNAGAFVLAGLHPDFVTRLRAASDALDGSLASSGDSTTAMSGATAGLAAETARGRRAVKVLDALVEPELGGDIALLAQWKSAKRIAGKSSPIAKTSVDAAAKGVAASPVAEPASAPVLIAPFQLPTAADAPPPSTSTAALGSTPVTTTVTTTVTAHVHTPASSPEESDAAPATRAAAA